MDGKGSTQIGTGLSAPGPGILGAMVRGNLMNDLHGSAGRARALRGALFLASAIALSIRVFPMRAYASVGRETHDPSIVFKKTILDRRFVAEGVAVADVNRDGKLDILAGNLWYEAPNWTPHEIAPYQPVDPAMAYSNCFNSWAYDVNRDGWPDQIVVGMPGEKAIWRENPKGKDQPWREHPIWRSACNESPLFIDLLGKGKPVLVMGYDDNYLAWFEPGPDPYAEWQCHNISEQKGSGSQRYSHGLGIGDVNMDGRNEILTKDGYYVAPSDPRSGPWKFVKENLGDECAQMRVYDVNGDHLPDVLSSSAHKRGVWWYAQQKGGNAFVTHVIDDTISETHSLVLADVDRDGVPDIVTGKRVWAHGPSGDVGAGEPAWLVWYQLKRTPTGIEWARHLVDVDSGVGTQFEVRDVNRDGLPDIIVSNKRGVFLFEQMKG